MTTIDRQQVIETAAKAMDEQFNPDSYPILAAMFSDYAATVVPVIVAAVLEPIRTNVATAAISCRARGDSEGERRWLDLTILLDRIEAGCRGGE